MNLLIIENSTADFVNIHFILYALVQDKIVSIVQIVNEQLEKVLLKVTDNFVNMLPNAKIK